MEDTETIEETNAQPTTKIVYRDIKRSGYMEYTMHIIIRNNEGESKMRSGNEIRNADKDRST
jgi:hypothetical protein